MTSHEFLVTPQIFTLLEHDDGYDMHLLGEASILGLLPSTIEVNATFADNIEDFVMHNFDVDLASGFFKLHANYSDNVLQGSYEVPILLATGYARLEANDALVEWYGEMSTFGGLFVSNSHGELSTHIVQVMCFIHYYSHTSHL